MIPILKDAICSLVKKLKKKNRKGLQALTINLVLKDIYELTKFERKFLIVISPIPSFTVKIKAFVIESRKIIQKKKNQHTLRPKPQSFTMFSPRSIAKILLFLEMITQNQKTIAIFFNSIQRTLL